MLYYNSLYIKLCIDVITVNCKTAMKVLFLCFMLWHYNYYSLCGI